jgi:hypothetical protein
MASMRKSARQEHPRRDVPELHGRIAEPTPSW